MDQIAISLDYQPIDTLIISDIYIYIVQT